MPHTTMPVVVPPVDSAKAILNRLGVLNNVSEEAAASVAVAYALIAIHEDLVEISNLLALR